MSDIQQRIAEILDGHWPNGGGGFCEGCDWITDRRYEPGRTTPWADHAAEVLVSELHLHSTGYGNYAWGPGIGIGGWIPDNNPAEL